jgi:hypothetical protein
MCTSARKMLVAEELRAVNSATNHAGGRPARILTWLAPPLRTRAEIMASVKQVLQMRKLYAKGDVTQTALAERFDIKREEDPGRRSWKHI